MPGALRRQRIRDLLELVGGARVLGLRVVVEIEHATLVHDDVLEDRPERLRHPVDLGLGLGREPDHLRVAAALEVEDTVVAPAMLVVADQLARRIGRERRLARAARPKKIATSLPSPTFAEQCIGKTPSSGSRSFISVKIDFLISPA